MTTTSQPYCDDLRATRIAALNDQFRSQLGMLTPFGAMVPGLTVSTPGIAALSPETQISLYAAVRDFSAFTADNDPWGERDFGALEIEGTPKIFWKIDYYADRSLLRGSEDPADLAQCFRVLTVMLASEY